MSAKLPDIRDQAVKEGRAEYVRQWAVRNRDRVLASKRKYYAANRDRIIAKAAAAKAADPERHRAQDAARYLKNKEAVKAKSRAWSAANKDRKRAADIAYAANNKDRVRVYKQNRRVREREALGRLSVGIVDKLRKLQRGKCAVCRDRLKLVGHHIDHIVALASGGSNTDDNVQLLCPPCNQSKGAKDPIQFMQSRGRLL